ncbi:hypothetical protein K0T92_24020 [Paenibacillus oenotherae]|uniref:Uncharacterized protein n=1 Tax=Paenibacillus oenotherae TaxID=1435645 RepID=A0ABS7DCW6_9BACL|nr:hypothetical protein [Paenibacillus oenotherae]MBW7477782.1 hypothetical protein [Paenibacillus oenotherae]
MAGWRNSLEGRWREWKGVEEAVNRTLAGRKVLRIAGSRSPRLQGQKFNSIQAPELAGIAGNYDAGLACFCISELPSEQRIEFLAAWHERLSRGATAVVADRRGEGCETAFELRELFAAGATKLDVQMGPTFWWARYEVL